MKFQVLQISFIIFSLLTLLLTYLFLFTNFSLNVEKIHEKRIIDIFENLKNIVSSYAKLSLYYSTTKNLREESHTWIHNGFNPLEFNFLKECKENITTYSMNFYLSNFRTFLPLNISINKLRECYWNLNERDVFAGKHDEAHFYVNCSAFNISISSENILLFDIVYTENYISNNRYWYLYRKIYEWARENGEKFASCVCDLVRACGDCNKINRCYEGLFESLIEKFKDDKYIKCRRVFIEPCCYRETGEPCIDDNRCLFWTKNKCHLNPKYECPQLENRIEIIHPSIKVSSSNSFVYLTCKWIENRMETSMIYECEDHKYYESTPSGPDKIVFRIGVFAGWKNYKACTKEIKCYYDNTNAECEKYVNNKCEKCLLPLIRCEDAPCYSPPKYMECKNCEVSDCKDGKCKVEKCEKCNNKDERC